MFERIESAENVYREALIFHSFISQEALEKLKVTEEAKAEMENRLADKERQHRAERFRHMGGIVSHRGPGAFAESEFSLAMNRSKSIDNGVLMQGKNTPAND